MATGQVLEIAGREVTITNPDKVIFPAAGHTKLDLVRYYLAVADGALRGVAGRPMILKRFVKGIDEEAFFQKRAPASRPAWIEAAELHYASGRSAAEVVVRDAAQLAWVVNLGCVDLNPHPVRAEDLDHPDELRIDLDPVPGVEWPQIVEVAMVARQVLADHGLVGWPKTSGSRGIHVYARIAPEWPYPKVRLAAETVAREVESRAPDLATSRWWKEEREGVFVDFNQNAKDRTVASAYSVRPTPDARVSTPLSWEELTTFGPGHGTLTTVPRRWAELGDPWAGMDGTAGSLDSLLDRAGVLGPAEKPPRGRRGSGPTGADGRESGPTGADGRESGPTGADGRESGPAGAGRRRSAMPLIEIARARTRDEALAGLARWRERHPAVTPYLRPADTLVDGMRGSSSVWYRIRINLRHVPPGQRPEQEELEVDYDPWAGRSSDG
ncbi:non-homologous end-joining DNA ligase [Plantactinospora sp. KBS50]|uniref:non-homologous end-joining DNA ligase n=1 Tax=Plantactinospora sp. KBS50 TaxID=2024580 RepID=UPI000BAAF561|nr:non-homologous end-joining DNA ligase [Plantactinospora sp. KBS50]ASW56968.1 DNA polymerase domain-containing protein [Plantactinospora sp. KBS50]